MPRRQLIGNCILKVASEIGQTTTGPNLNATDSTCKIWPSTLNLGYQPFAQNLSANNQTLIPPIVAAPGVLWPASLSDNNWTKQHLLPVVAPTMAANPALKLLSPNPQSFNTVQNREDNSVRANRIDFSPFTPSDWSLESFLTKLPASSSSCETQDLIKSQSATEISSTHNSHQVNNLLSIHVSCSSFYFLSQPISTPISRKRKEDAKKVEAINSLSDDSDIEIVWPLPDSNYRIRPRAPKTKPKYVSPVGQNKVKYLKCHGEVFLYIFYYIFLVFQKAKFNATHLKGEKGSKCNAGSIFDDSRPPSNSNSRPVMHQQHMPFTTTTATLHGPATTILATIPPTGGLSIENLQQTITPVQEPETWKFDSSFQSTESLVPSNDNEEFLMIDSGVYLFECEASNSSFNTTVPESPDQNSVKMEKSITGAPSNQVNC